MKVVIVYYSLYGHVRALAEAVAEGVRQVPGAEAVILRVPETLPAEVLEKMHATQAQAAQAGTPVATPADLASADAVIIGTGTRYGNMTGQMQQFFDSLGQLWATNALMGKLGAAFTSSATQHGGQETTIRAIHTALLHLGMVIAGLPYAWKGQSDISEITGGSPYGASTITGGQGERMPSANELEGAHWQGRYVAEIATKLAVK